MAFKHHLQLEDMSNSQQVVTTLLTLMVFHFDFCRDLSSFWLSQWLSACNQVWSFWASLCCLDMTDKYLPPDGENKEKVKKLKESSTSQSASVNCASAWIWTAFSRTEIVHQKSLCFCLHKPPFFQRDVFLSHRGKLNNSTAAKRTKSGTLFSTKQMAKWKAEGRESKGTFFCSYAHIPEGCWYKTTLLGVRKCKFDGPSWPFWHFQQTRASLIAAIKSAIETR